MIEISDSLKEFALTYNPEFLFGELESKKKSFKLSHTKNVTEIGMKLPHDGLNEELLKLCLQLHDIGRRKQQDIIGSSDDYLLDHHALALQYFSEWLSQHPTVKATKDWKIALDCCLYHGHPFMDDCFVDDVSMPYVRIVRDADRIENGCIGAPEYLEREKEVDNKGYRKRYPWRGNAVKTEILVYLERGIIFPKTLCQTYAEYFLFAASLVAQLCHEYPDIVREYMERYSTVEKYCGIFERNLTKVDADIACMIMRKL